MAQYNEDSIFTPSGLDYVRLRPTAFFNSTGIEGLVHSALEIITNAIDELALMQNGAGRLLILLCIDAENGTYQLVIKDNGRGLPLGKLLDSYTKMDTSGKFNTNAYETSGGLYGKGAKATAGTSRHFRPISHRPEGSASIYVNEGKCAGVVEQIDNPSGQTGVTVIYEPDPIVFPTDIGLFGEEGKAQLLTILRKYCFFQKLNVELRVYPLGLPADVWSMPIPDVESLVAQLAQAGHLEFSEAGFDRTNWIRDYWGVTRPFALQHRIADTVEAELTGPKARSVRMRYEARLYAVKFDALGGRFGMVNNVPIDDVKSTHFIVVTDALKVAIAGQIKDAQVRKFFIDQYRVPLFLAVDVKYPGAEFSGTTKHAFISREFRGIYEPSVRAQLAAPEGMVFVAALYQELAADIETKYNIAMTGAAPVKNRNRLFEEFPGLRGRFDDCTETDRRKTELFLVEGRSAGGSDGRDRATQGIFDLKGKPYNGVSAQDKVRQSAMDLMKRDIWKEIVAITGLERGKFNREALHFGRALNIMTDADDHGAHIASIVAGNLYVINPEALASGWVQISLPPLYSLEQKNARKGKSEKVYFRDENQLQVWMAQMVYMDHYDIGVRFKHHDHATYRLRDKQCVDFLRIILAIGEAITNIAHELVLGEHPLVVERLTRVTAYLEPGRIDVARIKDILKIDDVSYNPDSHTLVLTIGRNDHIIPLQNVRERLIEVVLPVLNRIQWRTTQIYITTRKTAECKERAVSIMELYAHLKRLDDQFKIERYKGLGSMPPQDKGRTCFDPEKRNVIRITSVGDVSRIFDLLGDDSAPRKRLLARH